MEINMLRKSIFAFLIVILSAAALAQSSEKVLARWSDGWYVGTIIQKIGDRYKVIFDDGDEAVVPQAGIRPIDWSAGTRLQCNFKGGGRYFWGRIVQKSGSRVVIDYDDGDKEATVIGRCRVPL